MEGSLPGQHRLATQPALPAGPRRGGTEGETLPVSCRLPALLGVVSMEAFGLLRCAEFPLPYVNKAHVGRGNRTPAHHGLPPAS